MVRHRQPQRQRLSCEHVDSGQGCPHCSQVVQVDESQAPVPTSPPPNTQAQSRRVWQAT
jgi:hypothetical protein